MQAHSRRRLACDCGRKRTAAQLAHRVNITIIDSVKGFNWDTSVQVASLLSAAFYDDDDAWRRGTARADEQRATRGAAVFGWSSLFALLLQHLSYGNRHLTLLAFADEQVVGCCGLTFEAAPADVAAATGTAEGSLYGLLTGIAVAPAHRRRGIASELLEAAARAAVGRLPPPALLALLVARTNTAAIRLYVRQGYEEQSAWVDTRWQEEAERGKVGKPRRLLMAKRLQQPQ
ncbi:hypothetical protein PLESTB_001570200 [Pleodorina starrii]|uniref:N-acetyltransferase domain-containing protein n=1 Tax=Pleodorina starrii TaxID=330485 RepID=A0A9W6F873_9CHLO|nr:hypothetical protein PLESTB_001570200 [Pleodorina starrii]